MTRLQADLCLCLTAFIWGLAFVAQKAALADLGPGTYVAVRFGISCLLLLPFAWRERRRTGAEPPPAGTRRKLLPLCLVFTAGVLLQQQGLTRTTVTAAGMITGLYVVLIPLLLTVLWRRRQPLPLWGGVLVAALGTYLLSSPYGPAQLQFGAGEGLMLASAFGFALQVIILGEIVRSWRAPLRLSCLQYGVVAVAGLALACVTEPTTLPALLAGLHAALWPILYGAVLSGGVAYTLQAVAQQHAPAADSGLILSLEGVVAAVAGIAWLHEPATARLLLGCALVVGAVLLVELLPLLRRRAVPPL